MPHITNLLLDRDGTLIADKHYLADPAGVELLPGVGESLARLAAGGMRFFLVSNQSGIGRGMFSREAAEAVNARLALLLRGYGVGFSDMLFCPHAPEERCDCRKPALGMWNALARRHDLAPEASMMIGDKKEDILFGAGAGLALRALVLSGKGRDTAAAMRLALPGGPGGPGGPGDPEGCLIEDPLPSQPHLVLGSFVLLPDMLGRFATHRGTR